VFDEAHNRLRDWDGQRRITHAAFMYVELLMLSSCRSNYSCWFHVGTLLLLLCAILSRRRRHHRYSLPRRRGPTESSPHLAHVRGLVKSVHARLCIKATTRAPVRCLLFSLSHEKAGLSSPFLGAGRAGDGGTWTAVTGALHMHPKVLWTRSALLGTARAGFHPSSTSTNYRRAAPAPHVMP
jgi:hypothetical protein